MLFLLSILIFLLQFLFNNFIRGKHLISSFIITNRVSISLVDVFQLITGLEWKQNLLIAFILLVPIYANSSIILSQCVPFNDIRNQISFINSCNKNVS